MHRLSFLHQLGTFAQVESETSESETSESETSESTKTPDEIETESTEQDLEQEFDALIDELNQSLAAESKAEVVEPSAAIGSGSNDDITDEEFESLLNELHGDGPVKVVEPLAVANKAESSDDITDDEFEALLDELHGKGKISSVTSSASTTAKNTQKSDKKTGDLIDDSEFEALLDELHGAGNGPASGSVAKPEKTRRR
ncbi:MAG: hypothetical protein Q9M92_15990 [Enterobacterales bacterium]|nr:hypothetical protein [Enterobacterales bacterium]